MHVNGVRQADGWWFSVLRKYGLIQLGFPCLSPTRNAATCQWPAGLDPISWGAASQTPFLFLITDFIEIESTIYLTLPPPPLFEKVLIDLLDVENLLNPASHVVADHEPSQVLAVDQDNPFAEEFRRFLRRG